MPTGRLLRLLKTVTALLLHQQWLLPQHHALHLHLHLHLLRKHLPLLK